MEPSDLPRRQQALRRVDEGFWRQSTSNYAEPIASKKRRQQTLGKAPRKAARVAKPGRQVAISSYICHEVFLLDGCQSVKSPQIAQQELLLPRKTLLAPILTRIAECQHVDFTSLFPDWPVLAVICLDMLKVMQETEAYPTA